MEEVLSVDQWNLFEFLSLQSLYRIRGKLWCKILGYLNELYMQNYRFCCGCLLAFMVIVILLCWSVQPSIWIAQSVLFITT